MQGKARQGRFSALISLVIWFTAGSAWADTPQHFAIEIDVRESSETPSEQQVEAHLSFDYEALFGTAGNATDQPSFRGEFYVGMETARRTAVEVNVGDSSHIMLPLSVDLSAVADHDGWVVCSVKLYAVAADIAEGIGSTTFALKLETGGWVVREWTDYLAKERSAQEAIPLDTSQDVPGEKPVFAPEPFEQIRHNRLARGGRQ